MTISDIVGIIFLVVFFILCIDAVIGHIRDK